MQFVYETLKPLIDSLPEALRDYWLLVFSACALGVLLPVARYQRTLRAIVARRIRPAPKAQPQLEEELNTYPMAPVAPGGKRLTVEGMPARLRLVVVAPLGKRFPVEETAIEDVLNHVLWGLGSLIAQDKPRIKIWPPQLSSQGFSALFRRMTRKPDPEGQPSHWVLLAGPTPPRPVPVLLGLGLWAEESTAIGRISTKPADWTNMLHIQTAVENRDGIPAYAGAGSLQENAPDGRREANLETFPKSNGIS